MREELMQRSSQSQQIIYPQIHPQLNNLPEVIWADSLHNRWRYLMLRDGHIRILLKELQVATIGPRCEMQYIQLLRILGIVVEQKRKIVILEVAKL